MFLTVRMRPGSMCKVSEVVRNGRQSMDSQQNAPKENRKRHLYFPSILLIFAAMLSYQVVGQTTMITANIIHRTFHIRWKSITGTGFTIDHKSKQYLVTARHIVNGIESGNAIKIFHDNEWKKLVVNVVGIGIGKVDVAVLACSVRLSPSHRLIASAAQLSYGQAVSFLGYPFGWNAGGENINRGIPLPFVKAGIVSAMEFKEVVRIFLDAHGNIGFSGGPVLFVPDGRPRNELHVAGVVSYYPTPRLLPIVDSNRNVVTDKSGKPIGYVRENPGIVVAVGIRHALELIDANPIGLQLPADKVGR